MSSARSSILRALEEAAKLGATSVGPEHLLLGIATLAGSSASVVLAEAGITPEGVRQAIEAEDAEVLAAIGISLDIVHEKVEQTIGSDAWGQSFSAVELPFTQAGKDAVNASVGEARKLRHHAIEAEHILLALLGRGGSVDEILGRLGASPVDVRNHVLSKFEYAKQVSS
jgi:ATP-dependent Clp protease ATP-binding subunit ClpA